MWFRREEGSFKREEESPADRAAELARTDSFIKESLAELTRLVAIDPIESPSPELFIGLLSEMNPKKLKRELKRDSLLFDKVQILGIEEGAKFLSLSSDQSLSRLAAEFEWLREHGVIGKVRPLCELPHSVLNEIDNVLRSLVRSSVITRPDLCRIIASVFQSTHGARILPLVPYFNLSNTIVKELETSNHGVLHVVIKAMPQPNEQTAWEDIIEFRNDSDSIAQRIALRRWISRLERQQVPVWEASEELRDLLHQYERHMAIHHMKANLGTVETVITGAGKFFEDMIKLKYGDLAKLPFAVRHRRAELLEAELNAPGREVAFIARAREAFPPNTSK